MNKEEMAKNFQTIEAQRNSITKALAQINDKKEEANRKIKQYEQNLQTYEREERMKSSRLAFLQETEREKAQETQKTEKAKRGGFISAPAQRPGYFDICYGRFHCFVYFAQFQSFKL